MNHTLDLLGFKQLVQHGPVPDIQLIKAGFGVDRLPEPGQQIIRDHHIPSRLDQGINRMRANIASAA